MEEAGAEVFFGESWFGLLFRGWAGMGALVGLLLVVVRVRWRTGGAGKGEWVGEDEDHVCEDGDGAVLHTHCQHCQDLCRM